MMKARIRRLLIWVALPALVLVLFYTIVGFYVVPRLIRSGVHDFVTKNYHRDVTIGDVRFNPYTLRLDVRDFALPDADGQRMLAFGHLMVDLTIASVWRRGPDFESILLEQPFVRVLIKPDGALNLSELALPPSPQAKPEPNPKPARLFINHFSLQGGNVAFEDRAHPSVFRTEIRPITFDLRNFATVGKPDGTYALTGISDAGERFSWTGSVGTYPLESRGQFEIGNLQAQTIWNYLRDSVQFELPTGAISIAGDYDFSAATSPIGLSVNVHNVTVTELGVRPKGATDNYIKLARLEVRDTRADVAKRTVDVGGVHLQGAEVRAWMPGAQGATVNLMELVGGSAAAGSASGRGGATEPGGSPGGAVASGVADATNGAAQPSAPAAAGADSSAGASPAAPPSSPGSSELSTSANTPAWVVSVPDIALDNLKVSAEDRQVSPAVRINLDDLNVHVTGFTTSHTTPVAVVMSTKINREGKLEAKADLPPDLASLKAHADLANFNLTVFQPYIARKTAMTLLNGLLSTKLNAERAADGQLAVDGEVDIAKFRTIDNELKRDFIKFDRLQFTGIDYQGNPSNTSKPSSLHIKNVNARAPYARVIIESDRSVNVSRVLSGPHGSTQAAGAADGGSGADKAAAGATAGGPEGDKAAASATAGGAPGKAATGAATASASAPDKIAAGATAGASATEARVAATDAAAQASGSAGRGHSKRRGGASKSAPAPSNNGTMAIAIDAIDIEDGSANYADLWIQPHFGVGIATLNGSILGLSSAPDARAKVELKGKVDRYAPVHIWGDTNPFAATAYSDIKLNFKGVELSSVTPYSGHFAGYKIQKGKLSVDIEYKIESRQLNAAHKFVIDQLELGDRVDSPDAVHLPLKIAVALLKDRNGVINVDLPVTGSLDDPQFKIGPLIWKAVLNLLTKVATAPFAMLGHLFGGGEHMNYIDFPAGSAVLERSEHDKLTALVKALEDKDKLELDVPLTYSPDVDRPALAMAHLNMRLLALSQEPAGGRKRTKGAVKTNTSEAKTQTAATTGSAAASTDASATTAASPASSARTRTATASPKDASTGTPKAGGSDSQSPASAIMDNPPPTDPAITDPAQRYHWLVALHRTELGKSTPLPSLAQAIETGGKKKDAPPPDFGAANTELEAALLQKDPVPDSELEALGRHRARAIQDVLLIGTDIDPSRVFVIGTAPKPSSDKDKSSDKAKSSDKDTVRVELALK